MFISTRHYSIKKHSPKMNTILMNTFNWYMLVKYQKETLFILNRRYKNKQNLKQEKHTKCERASSQRSKNIITQELLEF